MLVFRGGAAKSSRWWFFTLGKMANHPSQPIWEKTSRNLWKHLGLFYFLLRNWTAPSAVKHKLVTFRSFQFCSYHAVLQLMTNIFFDSWIFGWYYELLEKTHPSFNGKPFLKTGSGMFSVHQLAACNRHRWWQSVAPHKSVWWFRHLSPAKHGFALLANACSYASRKKNTTGKFTGSVFWNTLSGMILLHGTIEKKLEVWSAQNHDTSFASFSIVVRS